jgi:hypothetical protein
MPASLFSTPGATETVMCGAVAFAPVVVGSKEKTPEEVTSVSSITTACALPLSATPVARSRGPVEPRRGANFAIVCASGLKASVRWSAETFAWEGGALRERKSFFIEEVEKKKKKKRKKKKRKKKKKKKKLATGHLLSLSLSFSLPFFCQLTGRGVPLANSHPERWPRI